MQVSFGCLFLEDHLSPVFSTHGFLRLECSQDLFPHSFHFQAFLSNDIIQSFCALVKDVREVPYRPMRFDFDEAGSLNPTGQQAE